MDSQWPRFEVFAQEHPSQPHRNVGAVHAPDGELALLNARDVFVRRPNCHSLWVAPANQIYTRTAEELNALADAPETDRTTNARGQTYQVFQKQSQRQAETFVVHVGAVDAPSPAAALRLARQRFAAQPAYVWWIVADAALVRNSPDEAASMFGPALDKPYRQPNYYHVLAQMRAIKTGDTDVDQGPGEANT